MPDRQVITVREWFRLQRGALAVSHPTMFWFVARVEPVEAMANQSIFWTFITPRSAVVFSNHPTVMNILDICAAVDEHWRRSVFWEELAE